MKNEYPKVVDFRITSSCPYNCDYCFGPKAINDLPLEKIFEIILKFKNYDCQQIVLTGGEPLIRKDIDKIALYIFIRIKNFVEYNREKFFSVRRYY